MKKITLGIVLATSLAFAESAHHSNHLALFGGATIHDGHSYASLGIDYERYLTEKVGVVALGELINGHELQQIYGLGVAYHPISPLKLAFIPGVEIAHGHSEFLMRLNTEYAFHLGHWSVSPSASVDYVAKHFVYVAGVAVGLGF